MPTRIPTGSPSKMPTSNPSVEIFTPGPSPPPTPCKGRKWYLLSTKMILKECTNGYDVPPGTEMDYYDSQQECCKAEFSGGECVYNDVCIEEIITSDPTLDPTLEPSPGPTPQPSTGPTPSPTEVPTYQGSSGSTPTVSKETTGPPTKLPDRVPITQT